MYRLEVFYPRRPTQVHAETVDRASSVISRITELLAKHHACEKIVVSRDGTRLFAVDCKGNRLSD